MSLTTYDPKQIQLVISGAGFSYQLEGFAEDSFIKLERKTPSFSEKVGSQGEVVRSRSADKRATLTAKFLQTSIANTILSGLLYVDENPGGALPPGPFQVQLQDKNGATTQWTMSQAWVEKPPAVEYGKEAGDREWSIACASIDDFVVPGIFVQGDAAPGILSALPGVQQAITASLANL